MDSIYLIQTDVHFSYKGFILKETNMHFNGIL